MSDGEVEEKLMHLTNLQVVNKIPFSKAVLYSEHAFEMDGLQPLVYYTVLAMLCLANNCLPALP